MNVSTKEYLSRELTDIEYLKYHYNVAIKLSWLLDPKNKKGFDERFFDDNYKKLFGDNLSFIYTTPAYTFSLQKPRACPYTVGSEEIRILIDKTQNVKKIIEEKQKDLSSVNKNALTNLALVIKAYEESFGKIEVANLSDKIEYIINKFYKH